MEFEDLQAIWDTQNNQPVFSINDSRLAVGLYQQREKSRRRLFRKEFAPVYIAALIIAAVCAFLFLAFFVKTITRMRPTDPLMSVWDGAALTAAVAATLLIVVPMYCERRKHERIQNVFAPSLRKELEQGISQLDFELSLYRTPRVVKMNILVTIGAMVLVWESARLNGQPAPWILLTFVLTVTAFSSWSGLRAMKKGEERMMQRKRALETMLATLDEDVR
jgi:hypothetical protein